MSDYHIPVLLDESVSALISDCNGCYADATFGGAGHTKEILSRLGPEGRVIAFDRDSDAIGNAPDDSRLTLVRSNYRFIHNYILYMSRRHGHSWHPDNIYGNTDRIRENGLDGILADLGVSSHQFDTPERGFSFRYDTALDMRMDSGTDITAADIVNTYSEEDLARILWMYGEVDNSRKVADLICRARKAENIRTTSQLDKAIGAALQKFAEHKALARIYQALRIEVNQEMKSLEQFLYGAERSLKEGGRLVVITYHSLEDRMVKNFIRTGNTEGRVERDLYGNTGAGMRAVNRKPTLPSEKEISGNTRARSAKLRIAEKIWTPERQ